jgi:hypothetical protein
VTTPAMKFCPTCQQTLSKADFYKRSGSCKECTKEKRRALWRDDPEGMRAKARAYYAKDPEKHRHLKRLSVARDPERARERTREWFRKSNKAWQESRDPRTVKDIQLRSLYGIGIEEYEEMHAAQDGRCLICTDRPVRGLVVDHCHVTGEVRGLLCHICNCGLGSFNDTPQLLYRAIQYLTGGVDDDDTIDSEGKL